VRVIIKFVRPKIVFAQQCVFKNPMNKYIQNLYIIFGYGTLEDTWRDRHIIYTVDLVRSHRECKGLLASFYVMRLTITLF